MDARLAASLAFGTAAALFLSQLRTRLGERRAEQRMRALAGVVPISPDAAPRKPVVVPHPLRERRRRRERELLSSQLAPALELIVGHLRIGRNVTAAIAEVTAPHTRHPSLEIAITQESLAWTADGVRLPALRRCSEIFASLFEEPKGGTAARRRALRRKASVLDANLAEVRRLEARMGAADKGRLDHYLTSVREAEIRTRRADAWLDTPLPAIAEADRRRTDRDVAATMAGDYFRTVYDLIVLAFQTDVTRVATFSLGGEGDAIAIPEIGITESRHQLSHHGGDPGYMEKLTLYDTFAIEQFGYFLTRLAETADLDGRPLLDTTLALFGSGMCYGHSHGNANLPLVLAGGTGLGVRHGGHLDLNQGHFPGYRLDRPAEHYALCSRPANPDARMSNLLLLMAQRMGVEIDRFGDSTGVLEP